MSISPMMSRVAEAIAAFAIGYVFMRQEDTFRLAIQGCAALEELIREGIRGALPGEARRELMSLRFGIHLDLALGLGLISPEIHRLTKEIARLRNDLAHGKPNELTDDRARELLPSMRPLFVGKDSEFDDLAGGDAQKILSTALTAACLNIVASVSYAADERQTREAALEELSHSKSVRDAVAAAIRETDSDG